MNKNIVLIPLLIVCVSPLGAQSPESSESAARRAFAGLASFKPLASRKARLVGEVELKGHGRIPLQDQGVRMTLAGSMDVVADEGGRVLARNVQVAYEGFLKVSGASVSGYAYPEIYVPLYAAGRYIGSVKLSGPVLVSGRASGNWVVVSGRGRLWGYADLQD